jgi:hypothetical protein
MNNSSSGFMIWSNTINNRYAVATIYNCSSVNNTSYGFYQAGTSALVTVSNCYAGGNTGNDYLGTMTKNNCYSSDSSTGTTNTTFSISSGTYFTNITKGSEDLKICNIYT